MFPNFPVPAQFPCLKMDMKTVPTLEGTLRINVTMFLAQDLAQSKTSVIGGYNDIIIPI